MTFQRAVLPLSLSLFSFAFSLLFFLLLYPPNLSSSFLILLSLRLLRFVRLTASAHQMMSSLTRSLSPMYNNKLHCSRDTGRLLCLPLLFSCSVSSHRFSSPFYLSPLVLMVFFFFFLRLAVSSPLHLRLPVNQVSFIRLHQRTTADELRNEATGTE